MKERKDATESNRETDTGGDSDPFLKRWAKRKSRAERKSSSTESAVDESPGEPGHDSGGSGNPREAGALEVDRSMSDAASPDESADVEQEKGDEDMPSLDTIDQGGSVADFFSSRVSPALRQAALRRLFAQSSLPVGDGLDDYAEDYTKLTKLGDIVTTEMRHRMEVVRKRLLDRKQETDPSDAVADHDSDAVETPPEEIERQVADDVQHSGGDAEEIARADAERHAGDTRIAKENSKHDADAD